ncbi:MULTISPECIES: HDIG domain-containing metalloprotein [unclassified Lysinibacillus]|uniref:HD family phosphohydrolase n=1 Tax=unclassified Lysinibacillus TaxID=2636778 RepID=UPI0020126456|nr:MULTISPECIES: HDIG domain-containing metalloprotein [unclassified Lysinibacillus]MCL1694853.1 HDIG domain-containing protein [Lysinibacillus sp. BPa_S21]MCL1701476.1 HDIG domain-containing protein [Lysinibacillus sp. Bpr_S20]
MEKQLKKFTELIGFRYFLIVVLILTGALQFAFMYGNVKGVTYDFKPLQLAPETVRSTKTVEDTYKTQQEREKAVSAVAPVYQFSADVAKQRAAIVTSLFDYVLEVKADVEGSKEPIPIADQVGQLRKKFESIDSEQMPIIFTDSQLEGLLLQSEADLKRTSTQLSKSVQDYLQKSIRSENVFADQNEFETKIRGQRGYPDKIFNTIVLIGRTSIIENETVNEEQTKIRKAQAKESVEPTRILQGQVIVQEGQIIDNEAFRQLELLGMVSNKASMKPIAGLIILILLEMTFMFVLFERWDIDEHKKRNALLVTVIVYCLSILLMKFISLVSGGFDVTVAFLFPTALATLLTRLLADDRVAVLITVMTAASAGVIFQEGYSSVMQMEITLYIIFGGFASLFFLRSMEKRSHILQAVGVIGLVNMAFIAFYLLMTQSFYGMQELVFYFIAAMISALLSGALTMGLLPFFESAFSILSSVRLIELSNPNHPLLKKLLVEAPGTYHHSVMVANLAEAACEEIGADGLLARVGCYYHDIGKTKRPAFFIENQMSGINPHDSLPPEKSAEIIIAHTTDGAEMLKRYKMPQEIIDIALQHHGSSLLKYFYFKAKEEGKCLDDTTYRYPGPKPQTKEAAVISVADSVEAAVRSMKEPNAEKIQKLVRAIIDDRVQDNQFDECDISIKELKCIERVLCETLNGIFHSRIEYPKADK